MRDENNPRIHRLRPMRSHIDFGPPVSPIRGRHAKLDWTGGYEERFVPPTYESRHSTRS
jgi:hypothetical protein